MRRRWVRVLLWVIAIGLMLAIGVGSCFGVQLYRQTTITKAEQADALKEFDRARAQFPPRPPLIDIRDPGPVMWDIRVNKAPASAPRQPLQNFEVLVYNAKDKRLIRTRAPIWWMEFSLESLAARIGLPIGNLAITVEDVERYGRGIITDFSPPGGGRILVWTQ